MVLVAGWRFVLMVALCFVVGILLAVVARSARNHASFRWLRLACVIASVLSIVQGVGLLLSVSGVEQGGMLVDKGSIGYYIVAFCVGVQFVTMLIGSYSMIPQYDDGTIEGRTDAVNLVMAGFGSSAILIIGTLMMASVFF